MMFVWRYLVYSRTRRNATHVKRRTLTIPLTYGIVLHQLIALSYAKSTHYHSSESLNGEWPAFSNY